VTCACNCCRLTSLEVLEVHVSASLSFVFRGSGQTPAEKCSSMQQQLAHICSSSSSSSSSSFLAPSSWPSSHCLTTLVLDCRMPAIQPSVLLSAALQTVSLVELGLTFDGTLAPEDCASLQQLSSLTNLTALTQLDATELGDAAPAATFHDLCSPSSRLSNLQQLTICSNLNEGVAYMDLAQLPKLTRLQLGKIGLNVDLASLSTARGLTDLSLKACTGVGGLASLSPLTTLTRLQGPTLMQPPEGGVGAAAELAPAGWSERLQHLEWSGSASDATWPRLVPQLTSLTRLCMYDVCVSPAFCR
jgi:hypothetical protein